MRAFGRNMRDPDDRPRWVLRWRGLYVIVISLVVIAMAIVGWALLGLDHEMRGNRPGRVVHYVPIFFGAGALGIGMGVRQLVKDRRRF